MPARRPDCWRCAKGVADGWMQIGPRFDVPEWNNAGRASAPTEAADAVDPAVWAISCFFIRTKARGQGLTHRLVAAGIEHARASGASRIEACPMDLSRDSRSLGLFVGSTRVFEKAGFAPAVTRKAWPPADAAGALAQTAIRAGCLLATPHADHVWARIIDVLYIDRDVWYSHTGV